MTFWSSRSVGESAFTNTLHLSHRKRIHALHVRIEQAVGAIIVWLVVSTILEDSHCARSLPEPKRLFTPPAPVPQVCHPGECPPCPEAGVFSCRCGKVAETRTCAQRDFSCGKKCGRRLTCGRHACERLCHGGKCGDCPLSGLSSYSCCSSMANRFGTPHHVFHCFRCVLPQCEGSARKRFCHRTMRELHGIVLVLLLICRFILYRMYGAFLSLAFLRPRLTSVIIRRKQGLLN